MSNLKKRKFNRETETIDEKNKREKYETTDNIYLNEENFILEKVTNKRVTNDNIMVYTKKNFYYKGSVVNGLFSGQGSLTLANGDKYIGKFKDGKPNGQGTLTSSNGEYNGNWKDAKRNGQGAFTSSNGNKYIGQWKDNKENGQGTKIYTNGNKFVGQFKDGYEHGKGKMVYANGDIYEGEWKDGKPWNTTQYDDDKKHLSLYEYEVL